MTWPTDRPGYPMHAERDGWHWLVYPGGELRLRLWDATSGQGWAFGPPHESPASVRYLEPVRTPAEIDAAVQAEREACATQLDMMRKAHNDALIGQPHTPDTSIAYGNGAAAIRARGPTPALDAAVAKARREGMLAALDIYARGDEWDTFGAFIRAVRAAAGEEGKS